MLKNPDSYKRGKVVAKWYEKLPTNCRVRSGSVYYRKGGNDTKLSRVDQGESVFYERYLRRVAPTPGTLHDVMVKYKQVKLPLLAKSTQKDYTRIIDNILVPEFGHMRPHDVTPSDIGAYLEYRLQQDHGPAGNREVSVFGSVFQYAIRIASCNHDPTKGVRRNPEHPRTRYISDEQFREAIDRAPIQVRHMMVVGYLTGFRQKDLRNLTEENLTDEGLSVYQSKDGKMVTVKWSPLLRQFVQEAIDRSQCEYVLTNGYGQHWKLHAFQNAFKKVKAGFTFHDLRAKAESDSAEGLNLLSRYNRLRVVEAVR